MALTEREYNCIDTLATSRIYNRILEDDAARNSSGFDHACFGPALTMQLRGVLIDQIAVREARLETFEAASALQKQFTDIVGEWKWARALKPAPVSFSKLLYGKMKVRPRYSKDRRPTVGKEALTSILEDEKTPATALELVRLALELEVLEEDRKVLDKPLREDGRMHSSYFVAGTTTGRWTSKKDHFDTGANLQALSKRLHKIFIPDPGYVLINIDQKQGDSRCVAYLSRCKAYRDAHLKGNVHVAVSKLFWPDINPKATPLPWDANKTYYDLSKRIQHAGNYGQTPFGMARHLHIEQDLASEWQRRYFEPYPEIKAWHMETATRLKFYRSLTTPLGRLRYFLGRTWEETVVNEALAYVPQSMCSDINKVALWRIWNRFDPHVVQVLMEGHDSIVFQVKETDADVVDEVLSSLKIAVPVYDDVMYPEFEAQWGRSWDHHTLRNWEGHL